MLRPSGSVGLLMILSYVTGLSTAVTQFMYDWTLIHVTVLSTAVTQFLCMRLALQPEPLNTSRVGVLNLCHCVAD